ncbi:adhesion G-protein coupled receptor G6-like [Lytechinus pictus]|uniref:adhesion G-protein coupled receptor G6-like n=1 Tax=Lytechinus pictus TaxID=7653 RepID=UPI0030BA1852
MKIMERLTPLSCLLFVALVGGSLTTDCSRSPTEQCSQNFTTIGCRHKDCFNPVITISRPNMTTPLCGNTCASRGFYYSGLVNGTECWCANSPPCQEEMYRMEDNICGMPCPGDVNEFCGGQNAVQIYSHPGKHPVVGDWWFDGPRTITECDATNVLNIEVAISVTGHTLQGSWQLDTWSTKDPYADKPRRYNEAALSLSLENASTGSPPNTIHKEISMIMWDTSRVPSCADLRFLCVWLRRIDLSVDGVGFQRSCHEIICESNPLRWVKCSNNQCSCEDRIVNTSASDERKLDVIEKVNITEESVGEVLDVVGLLSFDDFNPDEVISTANIVQAVISLNSSDTEITNDVISIIDNLMNSDPEALAVAQGRNQSNSRMIQALEHQLQLVDLTKNNGSFTSVQPNLAVQIEATTSEQLRKGIKFISRKSTVDDILTNNDIGLRYHDDSIDVTDIRASASVTAEFEDDLDNESEDPDFRVAFAVARDPSLFISDVDEHVVGTYRNRNGRRRPNTPVILVTVYGPGRKKIKTAITTVFRPIEKGNSSVIIDDPVCVFWDYEASNGTGGWSGYGCFLQNDSDTENFTAIVCSCNHTTNFAVIMNFHSPNPSVIFQKTSKYLSCIGCGVSIGSLIITLAVYVLSPKLRQKQPNQIFMSICLSLLFLYVTYIMVVILNQQRLVVVESEVDLGDEKDVEIWCFCLAALIQYFTLTSLVWMGVEGVNMYQLFIKVLNARIPGFMAKASLVAWGLPATIVVVTGGIARRNYVDPDL